jgi:hypothetical protein
MKNGRYSTALRTLIPADPKEWTEAICDILEHAEEVDRLAAQIADDLRRNAERFMWAADRIAAGHNPEDPTGYSSLNDVATNCARHRAKQQSLTSLVRCVLGKDANKAYVKALRGGG